MRYKYLLIPLIAFMLFSCKKETRTIINPTPPPSDSTSTPSDPPHPSIPAVLLKDIEIPFLPSPYYHFEYDTSDKIALASFAEGFNTYNVIYNGDKIVELQNNSGANPGRLRYFYDTEDRINFITFINLAGIADLRFSFTYNEGKLVKIERERRKENSLIVNKTVMMSYYPDGNLMEINYHYPLINNFQLESTFRLRFERYDNGTNVDDIDLIHNEFFDPLIILPGVKLQKNNPEKEIRTGDGDNYTIDYNYSYDSNGFPQSKNGELTFTSGVTTGQKEQISSAYSYY